MAIVLACDVGYQVQISGLGVKLKFLNSGTFCFSTILAVQNGQSKNRPDWESRIMYPDVVAYYLSTICTLPEHLSSPVVFRLLDL
jgi:hypothetical protein